jgi:polysaccharide biosynthesis transport protein
MNMPEVLEERGSQAFDIPRLVGIVRRRHLQFLIPLFCGWLIVWGASWILPPTYKSTTTILVEQPTMPQNYVAPNISDDLQARIQSMKTELLSQTRLLTIIHRLHLYGGVRDPVTEDARVDRMRKDIDVELVRDSEKQEVTAFRISYSARDPHVAQLVTGELTDLFINENNKVRQQESEGTTSFLEQQLEDARQSLAEQEAKVRQFEGQHEGDLPTQQAGNLQILAGLQAQLQNEEDALNTAKQQRVYLQALLAQQRDTLSKVRPTGSGAVSSTPTNLETVEDQLEKLQDQLTDLGSRYTDQYPDVQSVKHQIAKLEAARDNLIAAEKAKSKSAKPTNDNLESIGQIDPTLSAPAQQTQGSLQANQLEITNREAAISNLKARISDYQGRLNSEPATEQQLADLNRGYAQSQANYDDLLKKRDESEMATSMERLQQGERFTMLDPPNLPAKPDFPNRLKFCGMGFGAGLALGLVVAGGFEFMDDRLHDEKQFKALLPVTVISEVPEVVSSLDAQKARRSVVLGWAATAIVFVSILTGSVFSYLHN